MSNGEGNQALNNVRLNPQEENQNHRMMYQIYTEDIRHTKNQQWLIIYYGLVVQAAIIGFCQLISQLPNNLLIIAVTGCCFFSAAFWLFGTMAIVFNYCDLKFYRARKVEYKERIEGNRSNREDSTPVIYLMMFILALGAGALGTFFYILSSII
ncbi:MAG: hypothetical protein AB1500_05265 [Bacillota bacterium]